MGNSQWMLQRLREPAPRMRTCERPLLVMPSPPHLQPLVFFLQRILQDLEMPLPGPAAPAPRVFLASVGEQEQGDSL